MPRELSPLIIKVPIIGHITIEAEQVQNKLEEFEAKLPEPIIRQFFLDMKFPATIAHILAYALKRLIRAFVYS